MRKAKLHADVFPGATALENVVRVYTYDDGALDYNVPVELSYFNTVEVVMLETNMMSALIQMPGVGINGNRLVRVYFDDLQLIDTEQLV
jgi:hypothetical protein